MHRGYGLCEAQRVRCPSMPFLRLAAAAAGDPAVAFAGGSLAAHRVPEARFGEENGVGVIFP